MVNSPTDGCAAQCADAAPEEAGCAIAARQSKLRVPRGSTQGTPWDYSGYPEGLLRVPDGSTQSTPWECHDVAGSGVANLRAAVGSLLRAVWSVASARLREHVGVLRVLTLTSGTPSTHTGNRRTFESTSGYSSVRFIHERVISKRECCCTARHGTATTACKRRVGPVPAQPTRRASATLGAHSEPMALTDERRKRREHRMRRRSTVCVLFRTRNSQYPTCSV